MDGLGGQSAGDCQGPTTLPVPSLAGPGRNNRPRNPRAPPVAAQPAQQDANTYVPPPPQHASNRGPRKGRNTAANSAACGGGEVDGSYANPAAEPHDAAPSRGGGRRGGRGGQGGRGRSRHRQGAAPPQPGQQQEQQQPGIQLQPVYQVPHEPSIVAPLNPTAASFQGAPSSSSVPDGPAPTSSHHSGAPQQPRNRNRQRGDIRQQQLQSSGEQPSPLGAADPIAAPPSLSQQLRQSNRGNRQGQGPQQREQQQGPALPPRLAQLAAEQRLLQQQRQQPTTLGPALPPRLAHLAEEPRQLQQQRQQQQQQSASLDQCPASARQSGSQLGQERQQQKQAHRPASAQGGRGPQQQQVPFGSSRRLGRRLGAKGFGLQEVERGGPQLLQHQDAVAADEGEEGQRVTCVICMEEVTAISVGSCGHAQVCAKCSLRMRMLYKDLRCPLCMTVNEEVVMVRPPPEVACEAAPPPSFSSLIAQRDKLWTKLKWAKGVYIQPDPPGKRLRPLRSSLPAMTARACVVCDPRGTRSFMSDKQLAEHMRSAHGGRGLCDVCTNQGNRFPLELEAFTPLELKDHKVQKHPNCQFCKTHFYANDELYAHMQQQHYHCHVCQLEGKGYVYFVDHVNLQSHMHAQHFLCQEPECVDCMTAFSTEDELREHMLRVHPRTMPRWNPSRARPLALDFGIRSLPVTTASSRGTQRGHGQRQQQQQQQQGGRGSGRGGAALSDEDFPPVGAAPAAQQQAAEARDAAMARELSAMQEAEGGLAVIDDDIGMGPSSRHPQWASGGRGQPDGGTRGGAAVTEDFPSLSVAASTSSAPAPAPVAESIAAALSLRHRPLQKVTACCSCGRRVMHLAVRQGEAVPSLKCNTDCTAAARRNALADAFGVEDPDRHVPHFDRHRLVTYSPALLQAAYTRPEVWGPIEQDIDGFVADDSRRRHCLEPMSSSQQRALAHELAEAYGLATISTGQEPNRAVQLLKTPGTGAPQNPLSAAAASLTPEALQALVLAQQGQTPVTWSLRLVDVQPGANPNLYLRDWSGEYTLTWTSDTSVTIAFHREAAYKAASSTLAGGVRNAFRVDRSQAATSGSTVQPPLSAAAIVASSPPPPKPAASAAPPPSREWLVMTNKRAARKAPSESTTDGASTSAAVSASTSAAAHRATPPTPAMNAWLDKDEAAEAEAQHIAGQVQSHRSATVADSWEEEASTGPVGVSVAAVRPPLDLREANQWSALEQIGEDEVDEQGAQKCS